MSTDNKVSMTINQEAVDAISKAIGIIRSNLPNLINLTDDQRKVLPKMGDKTVAFVNKSYEYAKQNSEILPKYLNMLEYGKDVEALNVLFKIIIPLEKLIEELDDTMLQTGSEAYTASLVFYSALKGALNAGQKGLKNIHDDLSTRFPGRPQKKAAEVNGTQNMK